MAAARATISTPAHGTNPPLPSIEDHLPKLEREPPARPGFQESVHLSSPGDHGEAEGPSHVRPLPRIWESQPLAGSPSMRPISPPPLRRSESSMPSERRTQYDPSRPSGLRLGSSQKGPYEHENLSIRTSSPNALGPLRDIRAGPGDPAALLQKGQGRHFLDGRERQEQDNEGGAGRQFLGEEQEELYIVGVRVGVNARPDITSSEGRPDLGLTTTFQHRLPKQLLPSDGGPMSSHRLSTPRPLNVSALISDDDVVLTAPGEPPCIPSIEDEIAMGERARKPLLLHIPPDAINDWAARFPNEERASTSSTTTSRGKNICKACRKPGSAVTPLISCRKCRKGYHDCCGKPKPMDSEDSSHFVCGRCLRHQERETASRDESRSIGVDRPFASSGVLALRGGLLADSSTSSTIPLAPPQLAERGRDDALENEDRDSSAGPSAAPPSMNSEDIVRDNSTPATDVYDATLNSAPDYKQFTCPRWKRDTCYLHQDHCMFAHSPTGRNAPYGAEEAKFFTCYRWRHGTCTNDATACPFAHTDTGLNVGRDNNADLKHITCYHWKLFRDCTDNGEDCLYAHKDTGILAWQPQEEAQSRAGKNSLKQFICPRWEESSQCKWIRLGCPYTHSLAAKSCPKPEPCPDLEYEADAQGSDLRSPADRPKQIESLSEHSLIPTWSRSVRNTPILYFDPPAEPAVPRPSKHPPLSSKDISFTNPPFFSETVAKAPLKEQLPIQNPPNPIERIPRKPEIRDPRKRRREPPQLDQLLADQLDQSLGNLGERTSQSPDLGEIGNIGASKPDSGSNAGAAGRRKPCQLCGRAIFASKNLCSQCSSNINDGKTVPLPVSQHSTDATTKPSTPAILPEPEHPAISSMEAVMEWNNPLPQEQASTGPLQRGPTNTLKRIASAGTLRLPENKQARLTRGWTKESYGRGPHRDPPVIRPSSNAETSQVKSDIPVYDLTQLAMVEKGTTSAKAPPTHTRTLLGADCDKNVSSTQTLPRLHERGRHARPSSKPLSELWTSMSRAQDLRQDSDRSVAARNEATEITTTESTGEVAIEAPTTRDAHVITVEPDPVPILRPEAVANDRHAVAGVTAIDREFDLHQLSPAPNVSQRDVLTNSEKPKSDPQGRRGLSSRLPRLQTGQRTTYKRHLQHRATELPPQNEDRSLSTGSAGQQSQAGAVRDDALEEPGKDQTASAGQANVAMVGSTGMNCDKTVDCVHEDVDEDDETPLIQTRAAFRPTLQPFTSDPTADIDEDDETPLMQTRAAFQPNRSFTSGSTAVLQGSILSSSVAKAKGAQPASLIRPGTLGRPKNTTQPFGMPRDSPRTSIQGASLASSSVGISRDGPQGPNLPLATVVSKVAWTVADEDRTTATLRARGVQFEPDSDPEGDDMDDADAYQPPPRRIDPLWKPQGYPHLFDIAPHLDSTQSKQIRGSGERSEQQLPIPRPKKQIIGNLLKLQCREHRRRFGDPHKEVCRTREAVEVTAVVEQTIPPDSSDPWALPQTEAKTMTMSFKEFAGLPEEAVINVGSRKEELVFTDGKEPQDKDVVGTQRRTRRVPGEGRYPFVYMR